MDKKVLLAVCGCVLLVVATMFVMVELAVNRNERNVLKSEFEAEIESTTLPDRFLVVGAAINEPFVPYVVIDAPAPCKPGERYDKGECRRKL